MQGNPYEPNQPQNQQGYIQPAPYFPYPAVDEHVSMGMWVGVFFLSCIPLVGLIMMFVWAFGSTPKKSLKNYARAQLLLTLIFLVIGIIVGIIIAATGASLLSSLSNLTSSYNFNP